MALPSVKEVFHVAWKFSRHSGGVRFLACLLKACRELTQDEFEAKRVSFFPSLQLTLNHILLVDWYYYLTTRVERGKDAGALSAPSPE